MLIMRRLRARRAYTANTGLPPPATSFGKTLFGGSWGRSDVNQHQGYAQPGPYGMQNMYHQGSMQAPQQNYGFEQNSAPPNYGSHGEDERETQVRYSHIIAKLDLLLLHRTKIMLRYVVIIMI